MTANMGEGRPAPIVPKVGDPVIVCRRPVRGGEHRLVEATVTKVGRVWVEMHAPDNGMGTTWRMRLDTRDEGNREYSQFNASFRTPEEHAWNEKVRKANAFLSEQRIVIHRGSPWDTEQRRVFLADLIGEVS